VTVRLLDFLASLSGALDLMSPEVVGHHKRVAYICARLAKNMGLGPADRSTLVMAALLHDVGGFSRQSRLDALMFETDGGRHAELGYRLLRTNPLLREAALAVRRHHTPRARFPEIDEPKRGLMLAGLLNLADRVDVLTFRAETIDPGAVMRRLAPLAGSQFEPAAVEALGALAASPEFWEPLAGADPVGALSDDHALFKGRGMSRRQLLEASAAFSQIIDFRSRFTATHSRGVAECAVCLAEKAGLPAGELTAMRLAGNLHDLGKLAVPTEILDKPGPLDDAERAIMHRHPEIGEAILSGVPGLGKVAAWASQHHEQPGGAGYPRRLRAEALSLGSRIMAVADVFTALREDRPYRAGIDAARTLGILEEMAGEGKLDPGVAALARAAGEEMDRRRWTAQKAAAAEFRQFYDGVPPR
jgi:putative nucleotidyltransferase with HDIG domain